MVYVHEPQLRGLEHMCHGQAWGRNSNIFIHGTTQLEVRLTPIEVVESERCNAWRGTWKKAKFLTSRIAQNPHTANSQPTSCDFASDIKLCYTAGAFDLAHSRSPWFSGFWPLNQTVFDASKDFCMEKQQMFQFSIFFTMLFVKVNRNLEWIAWQGRGSDGNPPYLPLSQLPRWMDWSDGWMNCMKCEIRFFVLGHFGTKWFDGLKMSPFLSAFFEVDSRPRVSTPCRGGSHHSIGNVQWHGCTSAAGSGSLERSFSKFDVAGCECWWSFWELWGEKLRTIASEEAVGNWWALAFAVDMFLQGKHDASQPDVARFWSSFL